MLFNVTIHLKYQNYKKVCHYHVSETKILKEDKKFVRKINIVVVNGGNHKIEQTFQLPDFETFGSTTFILSPLRLETRENKKVCKISFKICELVSEQSQ